MRRFGLLAIVAATIFAAAPVSAAKTVYQQSFSATFPVGSPSRAVKGAFKFTYDTVTLATTLDYFSMAINGITYTPAKSQLQFSNFVVFNRVRFPAFLIGGSLNGASSMVGGTDDFQLFWSPAPNGLRDLTYTTARAAGFFTKRDLTFTPFAEIPVAVVPEPATWAMMLVGFGLVGGAARRRSVRASGAGAPLVA
jgi:hypothetical protein